MMLKLRLECKICVVCEITFCSVANKLINSSDQTELSSEQMGLVNGWVMSSEWVDVV
jgi:hypothetical protein